MIVVLVSVSRESAPRAMSFDAVPVRAPLLEKDIVWCKDDLMSEFQ